MKPADKKIIVRNQVQVAESGNYERRPQGDEEVIDILDTDEDKVMGYYMNMSSYQERSFMHA